ncbi:MAG: hypothetical protein PF501_05280 [Salinisphaera sp.]|jgi:hypothetical protein|nr:hypothetical protein [Salinisphaera sp.]
MSCSSNQTNGSGSATDTSHPAVRWIKRQRLLLGGIAIVGLGLAFGWNWLAAVGALPILLSTLPCLIMMGFCMKNMKSCSKKEQAAETQDPNALSKPALLSGPSKPHTKEIDHA